MAKRAFLVLAICFVVIASFVGASHFPDAGAGMHKSVSKIQRFSDGCC